MYLFAVIYSNMVKYGNGKKRKKRKRKVKEKSWRERIFHRLPLQFVDNKERQKKKKERKKFLSSRSIADADVDV